MTPPRNNGLERGSRGGIITLYYDDNQNESFHRDMLGALKQAAEVKDVEGVESIWDLWTVYFEVGLPSLGLKELIRYLETRRVWRKSDEWPIYKTADTPCLAFTASLIDDANEVTIIALGVCYNYPADGEEGWWQNIILPRVRSL